MTALNALESTCMFKFCFIDADISTKLRLRNIQLLYLTNNIFRILHPFLENSADPDQLASLCFLSKINLFPVFHDKCCLLSHLLMKPILQTRTQLRLLIRVHTVCFHDEISVGEYFSFSAGIKKAENIYRTKKYWHVGWGG